MRNYKADGIIIKRRNSGEADRILTVFTRKNGKIQIKAAGIRKITSRRAPHVESFNFSKLSLYKGNFSLPILTEAHTIESFSEIKRDLVKVGFAYHICEIVDNLCPENQENEFVLNLLISTLQGFSQAQNLSLLVEEFEILLLRNLGFLGNTSAQATLNTHLFIEDILEKKLKTRKILPRFY